MRRAKKAEDAKKRPKPNNLAQYGLFDIPGIDDFEIGNDFNETPGDSDLEEELNMLLSSGPPRRAPRQQAKQIEAMINLDAMVAESLKDDPEDESEEDGEDDPSLLAELNIITGIEKEPFEDPTPVMTPTPASIVPTSAPISSGQAIDLVSLLKERTALYLQAESAAKENGDMAKARRLKRGLDQLKGLLRKAERGGQVAEDEIPLPVTIPAKKETPTETDSPEVNSNPEVPSVPMDSSASEQPQSLEAVVTTPTSDMITILCERKDEYKKAAVLAKRSGDRDTALAHIKVIKQFEAVIAAVESGQSVNLSQMPGPPPVAQSAPPVPPRQHTSAPTPPEEKQPAQEIVCSTETAAESPVPETPTSEPLTVIGALESRLAKFKEQEEAAKSANNARKQRMMGRIVKQYEDAIKLHKTGCEFPVDELPSPPGFPPIPVEKSAPSPSEAPSTPFPSGASGAPSPTKEPLLPPSTENPPQPSRPAPVSPSKPSTAPLKGKESRNEKQLAILLKKQKEFKLAALKAKQAGDLVQAKEFLRQAKHFDPVIVASQSGLPVDMDTLPRSPSKSTSLDSFEVVTITDCLPGSSSEIFERLLSDLKKQIEMCIETRKNFKATGDIANANRFEHMIMEMKRGLDIVKAAKLNDKPVPTFKYEKRQFSIVRCNPDLNDNELELSIIQGINFNVPNPKEIDTYVRCEFPSNEEPKKYKTTTIYNTNNPQYKATFIVPLQRSSRSFLRLFKRQAVKMEVWSKGGFLRSDTMVGTVQIKIQPLETKCTIHDAFDIMDGRKPLGGKLEVKLRVRTPMLTKQMEQIEEKWLVID